MDNQITDSNDREERIAARHGDKSFLLFFSNKDHDDDDDDMYSMKRSVK